MSTDPPPAPPALGKVPRTERGRRTLRKLLDAAAGEFAEKGFHETSITGITKRAGTALGSFYTYFDSKDEIFQALVSDMSDRVRQRAMQSISADMTSLETEHAALSAFLHFAREHKEIYRIIDEAEFADPESYRKHYETTAQRMLGRLRAGAESGEFRDDVEEAHAWAIMGMNVFLGLRFCVWSDDRTIDDVAEVAARILERGITAGNEPR
ncbi:MAG: TetR/AcrR family transcriptional regulator [Erythrobacter sp.]|nr:TetR/AcrR family transcriptional regulator [Erythrobacter sp.]